MSILSRLERILGRFAVPNMTVVLIAGQVLVYGFAYVTPALNQPAGMPGPNLDVLLKLSLIPARVLSGEVWRVVTFPEKLRQAAGDSAAAILLPGNCDSDFSRHVAGERGDLVGCIL